MCLFEKYVLLFLPLWRLEGIVAKSCRMFVICYIYYMLALICTFLSSMRFHKIEMCSCHPELVFPPHFLKNLVEVKAWGPPHVFLLWLGVSRGMLPVKYLCSNKAYLCQLNLMEIIRLLQG